MSHQIKWHRMQEEILWGVSAKILQKESSIFNSRLHVFFYCKCLLRKYYNFLCVWHMPGIRRHRQLCLNDILVCYLLSHVLALAPKGHCCHTAEDVPWPVNYRLGSQPASSCLHAGLHISCWCMFHMAPH